jgi:hypothetical protein
VQKGGNQSNLDCKLWSRGEVWYLSNQEDRSYCGGGAPEGGGALGGPAKGSTAAAAVSGGAAVLGGERERKGGEGAKE